MYRQSIIIFGMVIPGGVLIVALVGIWVMLGKFELKRDGKIEALKQRQISLITERALEKKLSLRQGEMEYWDEHLKRDTMQSFNENLDSILGNFDANQIRMLEGRRPTGAGEVGLKSKTPYARFALVFGGGFSPMQELLSELELRMPQLLLESSELSMGASTGGQIKSLKLKVSYLAWQE